MIRRARLLPLLLVPVLLLATGCGSDSSSKDAGSKAKSGTTCSYGDSQVPAARKVERPPSTPVTTSPTEVTIATNRGDITAELSADTAPCAVNSFLSLAKQGYFDNTKCHRLHVQTYYVLQCGDPTGTGGGGPGYQFDDELTGQENYHAGTLAMANSGPNTNGSQFFVVYGDSGFPPAYTVFGNLKASGLQVVQKIAQEGIGVPNKDPRVGPGDGTPKNPVVIQSVK